MKSKSTIYCPDTEYGKDAGYGKAALSCFQQTCGSNIFYMDPTLILK
jgi:hypothetical protein